MTFNTPTCGSPSHDFESQPASSPHNGENATYFDVIFPGINQRLIDLEQSRRQGTPEIEPFGPETSPVSASEQCAELWPYLAQEEILDEMRHNIPCAWYQLLRVFALLQLVVSTTEMGGFWRDGWNLFSDGGNHEEQSYTYWRNMADGLDRILDRMRVPKADMRKHVQDIQLEGFWEVELRHLRLLAAEEEQKHHHFMTQLAQQGGLENSAAPHETPQQRAAGTPRTLQARQPRKSKATKTAPPRTQKKGTTWANATSKAARDTSEEIIDLGSIVGDNFQSTAATGSKITYGLNAEAIINKSKRSLRDRGKKQTDQTLAGTNNRSLRDRGKKQIEQTLVGTRVIDGRVGTRKQQRRAQWSGKIHGSNSAVL
ncbi:hypothetical protein QBC43DRAFT_320481 [Cladorrhinum sp. PSN259]|nr:hypothetical protein QBC43DRAFT_320481 [Cladorrhinum sp. PSN259]